MFKEKKTKARLLIEFLCRWTLKLIGWRAVGKVPEVPKYVMIGYPHTSNWDTLIGLILYTSMGVHVRWLGKHSLFKGPLGWLIRKSGGIPIRRDISQNFVEKMKEVFRKSDYLVLTLSPEGTRKKTEYWRTGFYYIALAANVPIALGYLDYSNKTGGFGPLIFPSGDIEADLEKIRPFYKDIRAKFPENKGPIRIKPRKNENHT